MQGPGPGSTVTLGQIIRRSEVDPWTLRRSFFLDFARGRLNSTRSRVIAEALAAWFICI